MGSWQFPADLRPSRGGASKRLEASNDRLATLESDHLVLILRHLPVQSVLNFSMTCRQYRKVAMADAVWSVICALEWGEQAAHVPAEARSRNGWAGLYRDLTALNCATWHQVKQLDLVPKARASHSMSMVGSQLAMYGGGCDGGRHLDDTWLAAPEALLLPDGPSQGVTWKLASTGQPAGRFQQSCTVVGEQLLVFGGINDFGTRSDDTWVFKGEEGGGSSSWTKLQVAVAPAPRGAHAASYAGGSRVVVFGGIGQDGVRLGDTWILDMGEELLTWHQLELEVAPQARSGHSLTWVGGGHLVMFGGRGAKLDVLSDVWVLEVGGPKPSWVQLEELHTPSSHGQTLSQDDTCPRGPGPRAGHSATPILGGRVLIYGGEDERRGRKSDVWLLDPNAGVPVGSQLPPSAPPPCTRTRAEGLEAGSEFAVPDVNPPANGDLQVVPAAANESYGLVPELRDGWEGTSGPPTGSTSSWGQSSGTDSRLQAAGGVARAGGAEGQADRRVGGTDAVEGNGEGMPGSGSGRANGATRLSSGVSLAKATRRRSLWKEVKCGGQVPTRRSYHGACAAGGGCAVLVFGGMVDGERRGHTAAGLTFDDHFYILQLTQSAALSGSS